MFSRIGQDMRIARTRFRFEVIETESLPVILRKFEWYVGQKDEQKFGQIFTTTNGPNG